MFEVKVHYIPLATPQQQETTVSRQVMVPPPFPQQCQHPSLPSHSWLLPEGGVSGSQVQGKQGMVLGGGGLWPLARMGSNLQLHPPLIKDEDPPHQDLGQKRAGSGDEPCVSVI
ncbi:hypothetical protein ILYODFUR_003279 [Ilyodon furcidens]|uniref:Uncharacterized protein n=1 Tax=Ilyodon furcidens TaxID=33524 RepID=A0ABV0TRU9_9TELE